jgi:hypothetical protein
MSERLGRPRRWLSAIAAARQRSVWRGARGGSPGCVRGGARGEDVLAGLEDRLDALADWRELRAVAGPRRPRTAGGIVGKQRLSKNVSPAVSRLANRCPRAALGHSLRSRSRGSSRRALEREDRALLRHPRYGVGIGRVWATSTERDRALSSFVSFYNRRRPYSATGGRAPISRVQQIRGQDS